MVYKTPPTHVLVTIQSPSKRSVIRVAVDPCGFVGPDQRPVDRYIARAIRSDHEPHESKDKEDQIVRAPPWMWVSFFVLDTQVQDGPGWCR